MHSFVRPNSHILLRLPSGSLKLVEAVPNTVCSIGKFGSFPINLLLGRPYYLTFEITDKQNEQDTPALRVVPASELNAEILSEDAPPSESRADVENSADAASFDIVGDDGSVLMKNNRLTVDDASRQTLTMQEIEELKKAATGSGKEIIEKILKSHANLDEKTAFSLAKYTLRKNKKYMRRFTVLPMNASMLTEYMLAEKEASRIMELREESLGLVGSWANVHYGGATQQHLSDDGSRIGGGRWLVVDDTGGLIVASLAEKMGILYPEDESDDEDDDEAVKPSGGREEQREPEDAVGPNDVDVSMQDASEASAVQQDESTEHDAKVNGTDVTQSAESSRIRLVNRHNTDLASTNTIHVLHSNAQPNLSLLKYFSYDTNNPTPTHPLHSHLKTLSWLQLIDPASDATYEEPESVPKSVLETWKSGKRGTYYKKRRRWERCKNIVHETRQGGFDGLIIASYMEPATILKHTVPLLRGSGHVVVYSPTIEPLTELADLYSRDRKAAFIAQLGQNGPASLSEDDFPVDPRLLLGPSLQTSRIRPWQVLPGRTHPLMTYRGGAEGFVFTARKVTPVEGKVEARGKFSKKRKIA
ncbi:hypothetical protein MBLNU459_g5391t1 [Dothideomycetes sp. NU459]